MERKGSITVFLALILSLLLSLVTTGIQSVQAAAARTQILNSMDIGLYSLFGQYDSFLLKEYDLFYLDGTRGGDDLNLGAVYDSLKSYMKPVLKQNSQKLTLSQGGFTGYRLATDQNGEVFYHQSVAGMKETLGSRAVKLLLSKYKRKEDKVKQHEAAGERSESANTLQNYETEMNSASQKSQEAEETAKSENSEGSTDISSGTVEEGFSDGEEKPVVNNPIPVIQALRGRGILDLVIPAEKGISDQRISAGELLSGRKCQQGMEMAAEIQEDSSASSQMVFQYYLTRHLGNYMEPSATGLRYQLEYILGGKTSDYENLKAVANRLLLVREGVNMACLMADAGKRAEIQALALAIASGFLVPPAATAIEAALLLCWSFAESVLDLRELFHGGKVPLVKTSADWQLSLENLGELTGKMDSDRKSVENGTSYEEYLQILLLSKSKAEKVKWGMDMIEAEIRGIKGRENFRLDCCIEAIEASADVRVNRNHTFTVTRQYSYV